MKGFPFRTIQEAVIFVLHEKLHADTVHVIDWKLCRVLLSNNASYPWLILVPMRKGLRDFHDVALTDKATLIEEIDRASNALQCLHDPDKINVAALGNMVPQLHVHVIARFATDAAWPGPVWGEGPILPYKSVQLSDTVNALKIALK